MKLNALDHVNIITDDLAGTTRFFVDLFDLDVRDGPGPLPPAHVQWLYDEAGARYSTSILETCSRPSAAIRGPDR